MVAEFGSGRRWKEMAMAVEGIPAMELLFLTLAVVMQIYTCEKTV